LEDIWPSEEQARAVAIFWRSGDDFAHDAIDWLAVARLGGNLAHAPAPPDSMTGPTRQAKAALEARQAIVSGQRPAVRNGPVSFETLGALYFILTLGQYEKECANRLSPRGRHRWRFDEAAASDGRRRSSQTCDYCGDQRALPDRERRAP
jgi:hypothetical protein